MNLDFINKSHDRARRIINGQEMCSNIQSVIADVKRTYDYNEEEIQKLQSIQQDLLHQIEFQDLNVVDGYRLYKKLQDARRKRRILKDEQRSITPLYNLLRSQNGFVELLKTVQSNSSKENNLISEQKYAPRCHTDETPSSEDFEIMSLSYNNIINDIKREDKISLISERAEFYNNKLNTLIK